MFVVSCFKFEVHDLYPFSLLRKFSVHHCYLWGKECEKVSFAWNKKHIYFLNLQPNATEIGFELVILWRVLAELTFLKFRIACLLLIFPGLWISERKTRFQILFFICYFYVTLLETRNEVEEVFKTVILLGIYFREGMYTGLCCLLYGKDMLTN